MGNSPSRCHVLLPSDNFCNLGECVQETLANPSGIKGELYDLFLTKVKKFMFMGTRVEKVMTKIAINAESAADNTSLLFPGIKNPTRQNVTNKLSKIQGLQYELLVYATLIQPFALYKRCPFFPKIYGSSYNCTYDNVANLIKPESTQNVNFVKENVKKYLSNTERTQLILSGDNRQIINVSNSRNTFDPNNQLTFNFVVMEPILTRTLEDQFKRYQNSAFDQTLWSLIFQLAVACFAMECSKLMMNQTYHNILVVPENTTSTSTFVIGKKVYQATRSFTLKLDKFDKSYAVGLGENPNSIKNQFLSHFDLLTFLYPIYNQANVGDRNSIVNCLINTTETRRTTRSTTTKLDTFTTNWAPRNLENFLTQNPTFFHPIETIIEKLAEKAGGVSVTPWGKDLPSGTTFEFVLRKEDFSENGIFITPKNQEVINLSDQIKALEEELTQKEKELETLSIRAPQPQPPPVTPAPRKAPFAQTPGETAPPPPVLSQVPAQSQPVAPAPRKAPFAQTPGQIPPLPSGPPPIQPAQTQQTIDLAASSSSSVRGMSEPKGTVEDSPVKPPVSSITPDPVVDNFLNVGYPPMREFDEEPNDPTVQQPRKKCMFL